MILKISAHLFINLMFAVGWKPEAAPSECSTESSDGAEGLIDPGTLNIIP